MVDVFGVEMAERDDAIRKCSICQKRKVMTEFYWQSKLIGKRSYRCRDCAKKYFTHRAKVRRQSIQPDKNKLLGEEKERLDFSNYKGCARLEGTQIMKSKEIRTKGCRGYHLDLEEFHAQALVREINELGW